MSSRSQWIKACLVVVGVSLLLTACSSINTRHPQVWSGDITAEQKLKLATVYFIRPETYKTKGVANNEVRIEFQGRTLLTQAEGNYALLYIKPSKGTLKIHSETKFINSDQPVAVWRARGYKFIAGKTYFIYVRQINEEFRGVFYEPEPVSLREAKELIVSGEGRFGTTLATGAARNAPIGDIVEVKTPPASAIKPLAPALPENVYKQEKYLKKRDKF